MCLLLVACLYCFGKDKGQLLNHSSFWQELDESVLKAHSAVALICDFHSSGIAFFEQECLLPFFETTVKRLPSPKVLDYLKKYCQKHDLSRAIEWLEEFEKTLTTIETAPSKNIFETKIKDKSEHSIKQETESKVDNEAKNQQLQNPNPHFRKEMFFTKYIVEERVCTSTQVQKPSDIKPKPSNDKSSSAKYRKSPYPTSSRSPKANAEPADEEPPKIVFNRRKSSNTRVIKPTQIKIGNPIKRPPQVDNILDPRKVGVKDLNRLFLNPNDYSLDEAEENILQELSRNDSLNNKANNSNGIFHNENTRSIDFDIFNGSQIQKRTPSRRDYLM